MKPSENHVGPPQTRRQRYAWTQRQQQWRAPDWPAAAKHQGRTHETVIVVFLCRSSWRWWRERRWRTHDGPAQPPPPWQRRWVVAGPRSTSRREETSAAADSTSGTTTPAPAPAPAEQAPVPAEAGRDPVASRRGQPRRGAEGPGAAEGADGRRPQPGGLRGADECCRFRRRRLVEEGSGVLRPRPRRWSKQQQSAP